ncbi:CPBP family intramembrane metalloprotease [Muricauda sp. CAU 1633]|uniref:CPBP family intramembrane glutamic endopeptidase n=1 Tax=Allomuricauda sp. CAU 1633 TaxID=2816036 RepID=UPI001A8CF2F0|nr:type II CAAX endopeptidase family protein [Muricauda sp. CAU 1633]MBO0323892.1 CPBP family intramembrane metalloprotease [Muricauda sp. CAU 1633]
MKKAILLVEILIFVLLVVLDAKGYLPISQTLYIIPFIWIVLKLKKEKFASIGWGFKDIDLKKAIIIGIGLGIVLELFATYVTTPLLSDYFNTEPDLGDLKGIRGNLAMLLLFTILSWVLAAIGEEICFRGFLMNRIANVFGSNNAAWIVALVLSSILFGWGHTEQGITGWIQEGLSGLFLGIIFLKSNKNLTIPIIAHGVSNTLAFILIYLGEYPGV